MTAAARPARPRPFNPRGKAPQVSAWGDTYNYAGQCAKCGRNVYSVTVALSNGTGTRQNEPDPRGYAGPRHSLCTLEDYPGVLFCWDCVNEHGSEGWKVCERIARAGKRSPGLLHELLTAIADARTGDHYPLDGWAIDVDDREEAAATLRRLNRLESRSRRNARLAEQRRVAIVTAMERLDELQARLRETAAGLRVWYRSNGKSPLTLAVMRDPDAVSMHPFHAANRLERMADEINAAGRQEERNGKQRL